MVLGVSACVAIAALDASENAVDTDDGRQPDANAKVAGPSETINRHTPDIERVIQSLTDRTLTADEYKIKVRLKRRSDFACVFLKRMRLVLPTH